MQQPIIITESPLSYAEYQKLSFTEFRKRHPAIFISLPIILLITLGLLGLIVIDGGFNTVNWQDVRPLLLIAGAISFIWVATLYSLRRTYSRSNNIRDGVKYRLDENGIAQVNSNQELVLWSNIERTATVVGQWVLLRQANYYSKEIYFLNSANIVHPANCVDFHALLKLKRIKPI